MLLPIITTKTIAAVLEAILIIIKVFILTIMLNSIRASNCSTIYRILTISKLCFREARIPFIS